MVEPTPGIVRYYWNLLPDVLRVFQSTVRTVLFWIFTVVGSFLVFFHPHWAAGLNLTALPQWAAVPLLGAGFLFAVLRASHRKFVTEHEIVERITADLETSQRALETSQRRPRQRSITDRPALIARLLTQPPGTIHSIVCVTGTPEPCRFATQLQEVLIAGGWTVGRFIPGMLIAGRVPEGVEIEVEDPDRPPPQAVVLRIILEEAGVVISVTQIFRLRVGPNPDGDGVIQLKVGHDPSV